MSRSASADLEELVTYIRQDSPQNARKVVEDIHKNVERLRRFPRSGETDPGAPPMHGEMEARIVRASGFLIRYAFPVRRGAGRDVVYVVSIQRAGRLPLDDTDYMLRFLQEAAGVYA